MKLPFDQLSVALLLTSSVAPTFAHPQPITEINSISAVDTKSLDARDDTGLFVDIKDLWKRKGGGGSGGKGGGGSSGGSSGKGSGSSSSSSGGRTSTGSGVQPSYGGGRYYGGGSSVPYSSGVGSPSGINPVYLAAGVGAGAILIAGVALYGLYEYPYKESYTFYNASATSSSSKREIEDLHERQQIGFNQTKPVVCICAQYNECSCDDTGDTSFLASLVGNGSYAALNKSQINVGPVNGVSTLVLNGTLPNGTTAPGGTEDPYSASSHTATPGLLLIASVVGFSVFLI